MKTSRRGAVVTVGLAIGIMTAQVPAHAFSSSSSPGLLEQVEQVVWPAGSQENPHPWGTTFDSGTPSETGRWAITVNHVELFADEVILAEYERNRPLGPEFTYIMVNLTATNLGPAGWGNSPYWFTIDYTSPLGDVHRFGDVVAVEPDPFDFRAQRSPGQSVTGNVALAVPVRHIENGTVSVSAGRGEKKGYFPVS